MGDRAKMRIAMIQIADVGTFPAVSEDGIEGLHGRIGDPQTLGQAIAESLQEIDLYNGRRGLLLADGQEIYLMLTIRIREADNGESARQIAEEWRREKDEPASVGDV